MYFHPLNFIRFLLAMGVVLFHYGMEFYPFREGPLHTLIAHSGFRVSFFFFISGFVMTLVYGPQAAGMKPVYFYKKRLSRILPMYWLAFIITLLLVLLVLEAGPKGLVIITHFLGLQSFYPGYVLDLNFPTWSISVELFFYALFPFLLAWMNRLNTGRLFFVTLVLWLLQTAQHVYFVNHLWNGSKAMEEFINAFPLWHLVTFIVGMSAARMIALGGFPEGFRKQAPWYLLLALLVFGYLIFVPNGILKYIHNGLLAPLFVLVVAGLYYDRSAIHRFLSLPWLSRLGDLSYGLFIFQYPVWIVMNALAGPAYRSSSWFFVMYLVVLLLFAGLVHRYFERPLLGYFRGKTHRGRGAQRRRGAERENTH